MNERRRLIAAVLLLAVLFLSACAHTGRVRSNTEFQGQIWRGRLALRFDDPSLNTFFAGFELSGDARNGELNLYSPLGNTVASLHWTPQAAWLLNSGESRSFDSLETLAQEATGAALPIAAIFLWLKGQDSVVDGWQSDLSQLAQGRLQARRSQPLPAAELRLILEP